MYLYQTSVFLDIGFFSMVFNKNKPFKYQWTLCSNFCFMVIYCRCSFFFVSLSFVLFDVRSVYENILVWARNVLCLEFWSSFCQYFDYLINIQSVSKIMHSWFSFYFILELLIYIYSSVNWWKKILKKCPSIYAGFQCLLCKAVRKWFWKGRWFDTNDDGEMEFYWGKRLDSIYIHRCLKISTNRPRLDIWKFQIL